MNKELKTKISILRQKAEGQLHAGKSKVEETLSESEILRLIHELETHQIELEMQNNELLQAKEEAVAAAKKYTELFDFAPVGFFTLSQNGDILELNFKAAQLIGKNRHRLRNKEFGLFVTEESKITFVRFMERLFASGHQETCEISILGTYDQLLTIELIGIVTDHSTNCIITAIDITEKKEAIDELEESKNRIAAILNAIPDLIFIQNYAGDYIDCHAAQVDDLFITPDQFLGKNIADILPNEFYQIIRATFNKAIETKQVQSLEYSIPTPMGEQYFDMKVIAYDEDRILSICRNITERYQAVSALKESEEQLKEIFDNSADNIFVIDVIDHHTFKLRRINTSMEKALNKGKDEIENQFVEVVFPNHKETMYESHYQQCIDSRTIHRYEEIAEIGNRLINYSTILVPLFDEKGKVFRLIGISRDSTERKQRESSMIHADRMTSLGEMASGMAHEINQPLNNISLVMENVLAALNRDQNIPEDYLRKKINRIFENIERIRKIIDHVRVFSRRNIESELTYFDVNECIAKSISMVSQQFYDNRIKLNFALQKNLPEVDGNLYKFEQVILNLLSNARDSLLEKRANAKILKLKIDDQFIEIKSFMDGNHIKIAVYDNGIGIDQSIINHIMLPFYTTKEVGKGTGLGLSISHQIIKEMNGNIEITSELGHSTTFTIILNIEKRDL